MLCVLKTNVSLKMFFLVPACGWVKVFEIFFLVELSYLVKRMASPQENLISSERNQPAHFRSMISAFVVRSLERKMAYHASCEIRIF